MPIPAHKALRWASDPATHALLIDLADTPESDHSQRHLKENRLLRHAAPLFRFPKGCIPTGPKRQESLVWLVNLINKTLELHLRHDTTDQTVPPTEAPSPNATP
jgi:hypothetical protein